MYLLSTLVCLVAVSQDPTVTPSPVRYAIQPVQEDERVQLHVSMIFHGSASGATTVRLPRDQYGTPRLFEFVHDVRVSEGVSLSPGERPDQRRLSHKPGAEITFGYRIDFDPSQREGSAYRPSVGPRHFHFLGPQWMARIEGEDELERELTFELREAPEGWALFGSFGVGPGPHRMQASFDDMVATVLGGGDYQADSFEAGSGAVHTFVHGPFDVGTETLLDAVRKIVTYQRGFFRDEDEDLLVVTLTRRDGLLAGTSIRNAMICYASGTSTLTRLSNLLAHEMFHQWLPRRGRVDPGSFDEAFDWMDEGFTEYFGRRLLLEQELMTPDEYLDFFNRDLRELARNPYREMTNSELEEVHRTGSFTNVHYRLSYLRGALIALDWDARIRAAGKGSLADAIRELVAGAAVAGGALPQDAFHQLMDRYGIDSRRDIDKWIDRGEAITPSGNAFGTSYELRSVHTSDPGFRRETSERRGVLVGVAEDGPAHEAGLRNGMELVSVEDGEGVIRVEVRVDGELRRFEYAPEQTGEVLQYVGGDG